MFPNRFISCLSVLVAASLSAQSAMVWQADFSSYDTSGGAVDVTVDSTGNDDTLSGKTYTPVTGMTYATEVADSSSLTNPLAGNALRLTYTNNSGSTVSASIMQIFQGHQTSLGGSGIYIMSADMARTSSNGISGARSYAAVGDESTTGSNNTTTGAILGSTPWRFTFVVNQTGGDITLPGTLGTLTNNRNAAYFFDGATYSGLATISNTSLVITGFATGTYRSNALNNGSSVVVWYDNMGLWNSASDTVGVTSVLSLAPGTVIPVPEPSTIALSLLAGVTVIALRRRAVRAI